MPRGIKREISPDGLLACLGCWEEKHITEFYLREGAYFCVEEDGVDTWYGRPWNWKCIACNREYQRERQSSKREVKQTKQEVRTTEEQIALTEVRTDLEKQGLGLAQKEDGTYYTYKL